MKKIIAIFACLTMLCSLTACSVRDDADKSGSDTDTTTAQGDVTNAPADTSEPGSQTIKPTKIVVADTAKNYKGALIAWATATNITKNGNAFEMTFKIKDSAAEGEYAVNLYDIECSDDNYQDVVPVRVNGKVKVSAAGGNAEATPPADKFTVALGNAVGAPGSEVKIPVQFLSNTGIAGTTITMYYDSDVLELKEITLADSSMQSGVFIPNTDLICDFVQG